MPAEAQDPSPAHLQAHSRFEGAGCDFVAHLDRWRGIAFWIFIGAIVVHVVGLVLVPAEHSAFFYWTRTVQICKQPDGTHFVRDNAPVDQVLARVRVDLSSCPSRVWDLLFATARTTATSEAVEPFPFPSAPVNLAAERPRISEFLASSFRAAEGQTQVSDAMKREYLFAVRQYAAGGTTSTRSVWPKASDVTEKGGGLLYVASLLFMLGIVARLGFYKKRGLVRQKRGSCPHCAYSVPTPNDPCPECGTRATSWTTLIGLTFAARRKLRKGGTL